MAGSDTREGFHEQNDRLLLEKADGGFSVSDAVRQEFGRVHIDEAGMTMPAGIKPVPIYGLNALGRQATHVGHQYVVAEETGAPGEDYEVMHQLLDSACGLSSGGNTQADQERERYRRKMNWWFGLVGTACLVFGLVVAPALGIKLGVEETPPLPAPAAAAVREVDRG